MSEWLCICTTGRDSFFGGTLLKVGRTDVTTFFFYNPKTAAFPLPFPFFLDYVFDKERKLRFPPSSVSNRLNYKSPDQP